MSYKLADVIWNDDGTLVSKELTPLVALKEIGKDIPYINLSVEYKIIENALKRLEELEKAFGFLLRENEKVEKKLSKEIEKKLKALEIIKKNTKIVDYSEHNGVVGEEFIIFQGFRIKTKQEYDLLKEVFDK